MSASPEERARDRSWLAHGLLVLLLAALLGAVLAPVWPCPRCAWRREAAREGVPILEDLPIVTGLRAFHLCGTCGGRERASLLRRLTWRPPTDP